LKYSRVQLSKPLDDPTFDLPTHLFTAMSPSIDVRISTSSSILDLTAKDPFPIIVDISLNHTTPITFQKRSFPLLDGRILRKGGLAFKDTATGQLAIRNTMTICYAATETEGITPETHGSYMTLWPGQKHTLDATMAPFKSKPAISAWPGMTAADYFKAQDSLPDQWKWQTTHGLEDGVTYEIGIGNETLTKHWWEGSVFELLGKTPEQRERLFREENVPLCVIKTTRFFVKRPGNSASFDWP
jgi:hypothetical protein